MPRAPTAVLAFVAASCGTPKADGSLLTPYLAVADALAEDRTDPLAQQGAALSRIAEGKHAEPGVAQILADVRGIDYGDIAAARVAFRGISLGMIEHLRANPAGQSGHMLVHCTMTFDGEGAYWVQQQGTVRNPYEGARMLHCGDVVDWTATLPAP